LRGYAKRAVDGGRHWRTASAGHPGERALRSDQRARRWQQNLGTDPAKRDHRDLVAAYVAIGEQKLNSTLRLRQAIERRGARRIDGENGQGRRALLVLSDAKIAGFDPHPTVAL
jgi:hypothetical protein